MTFVGWTSTNQISELRSQNHRPTRPAAVALAAALSISLLGLLAPSSSFADSVSLDGSWRGSGWVKFDNGKRERASCRAYYSRVSPSEFTLRANCATRSAKATQTARVHKTGKSAYSGTFFNKEFGVSGNIYVSVKGRSQHVRLSGSGASATFRLRK